jgi:hypothetical protein
MEKPGGGWTFGSVTILSAMIAPVVVWLANLPQWIGTVLMVAFLVIHMMWGAHGYYPNNI